MGAEQKKSRARIDPRKETNMPTYGGASWSGGALKDTLVQFSFAAKVKKRGKRTLLSGDCKFLALDSHGAPEVAKAMAESINRNLSTVCIATTKYSTSVFIWFFENVTIEKFTFTTALLSSPGQIHEKIELKQAGAKNRLNGFNVSRD